MSPSLLGQARQASRAHPSITQKGNRQTPAPKSRVGEIAVCTNRTCRRQGSTQILRVLEDLELNEGAGIDVRSSGCLGSCGSGPNVGLDSDVVLHSVGTVHSAFKVLKEFCSYEVPENLKQCIQLKLRGNALAQEGKLEDARDQYKQALEISPTHMAYKLHSNLSLVALSAGDSAEAIAQATQALDLAPEDFTTAKIRMVEACLAAQRNIEAQEYLELAVLQDRSFSATPIFKDLEKRVSRAVDAEST